MRKIIFLALLFGLGCKNFNSSKRGNRFETSLIKGTWQYCDKYDGYKLMELTDSIYYFVDNGEYAGPYFPSSYLISGDTLAYKHKDGSMDKSNMWQIKRLDTAVLFFRNNSDSIMARRVKLSMLLSKYSYAKREDYMKQYKNLRKQFDCK